MPSNRAASILTTRGPLTITNTPYPTALQPNQLIVRTRAIVLNPVDPVLQKSGPDFFPWLQNPIIPGFDVAGDVVEVGPSVTRFKPGDRVFGLATGTLRGQHAESGFQEFVVLKDIVTARVPENLKYEDVVVLPLGLSTVAGGLFGKDYLGLRYPSLKAGSQTKQETEQEILLVWGGSTSLGCNAIQLAVAAGYEVIATASPRNFDLVKRLGVSSVVDYHSETVVDDLVDLLKERKPVGALGITVGSYEPCLEVLRRSEGRTFVASGAFVPAGLDENEVKFIIGIAAAENEIGPAIWERYVVQALEEGSFAAEPKARVVGEKLEDLQDAIHIMEKGVSAEKLVVRLD